MTEHALTELLEAAWVRSDALFALLDDDALPRRPVALRHPFLFYLGHLPAFAWNQVSGALGLGRLDPTFDALFARGIDPAEAPADAPAWPTPDAVRAYRDRARRAVLAALPDILARDDELCRDGRIVRLVAEHERMHHETLLYLFAQAPEGLVRRPAHVPESKGGEGRAAERRRVEGGPVRLGVALDEVPFAWDNELGRLHVDVPAFEIDALPVRNREWLAFLRAFGDAPELRPAAWTADGVRTVFGVVPFERAQGWPVQVSGAQARAYCSARGGRLPTEAELHRAAFTGPDGPRRWPWGDAPPDGRWGNLDFARWSPAPVGSFPQGGSAWGVEELVGNGWEWTGTPFGPLPGFRPWARTYPGYSADFFDGEHDVVFGASWATDRTLLRPSFRNWYRRTYPYAFTKFRVVRP